MLEFPPQDGIEVYAGCLGKICFKSNGDLAFDQEEKIVSLTIGQFRSVVKNANQLIAQAEANMAEVAFRKAENEAHS
jgi:hypothetical protein